MDSQICFRSDHFVLFVVVTLAIILWVIYQIYIRSTQEIHKFYKNMADMMKSDTPPAQETNILQVEQPPEEPYQSDETSYQPTEIPYQPPQMHRPPPQMHRQSPQMHRPPQMYHPSLQTQFAQRPPVMPAYPYDDIRYGDYQLVGYVFPHRHPDQMFRLMGRRYDSYKYEYYVIHPYTDIRIPIKVKNDWELNTGDHVDIPGFKGHYVVNIYDIDRPF